MKDSCSHCTPQHPDHGKETARLNRVSGQIEGIRKMIAERRYCPEILTQLRAVQAALRAVESNIMERHLQACVSDALREGDTPEQKKKIAELMEIFKRYE